MGEVSVCLSLNIQFEGRCYAASILGKCLGKFKFVCNSGPGQPVGCDLEVAIHNAGLCYSDRYLPTSGFFLDISQLINRRIFLVIYCGDMLWNMFDLLWNILHMLLDMLKCRRTSSTCCGAYLTYSHTHHLTALSHLTPGLHVIM